MDWGHTCMQVCMAIENQFHRVLQCSHVKHSHSMGLLAQADVICDYICDLLSIRGSGGSAGKKTRPV